MLNKLLEDGNTLYRSGRLEEAIYRYKYALKRVPVNSSRDQEQNQEVLPSSDQNLEEVQFSKSHQAVFNQMKSHIVFNLSLALKKLEDVKGLKSKVLPMPTEIESTTTNAKEIDLASCT